MTKVAFTPVSLNPEVVESYRKQNPVKFERKRAEFAKKLAANGFEAEAQALLGIKPQPVTKLEPQVNDAEPAKPKKPLKKSTSND